MVEANPFYGTESGSKRGGNGNSCPHHFDHRHSPKNDRRAPTKVSAYSGTNSSNHPRKSLRSIYLKLVIVIQKEIGEFSD